MLLRLSHLPCSGSGALVEANYWVSSRLLVVEPSNLWVGLAADYPFKVGFQQFTPFAITTYAAMGPFINPIDWWKTLRLPVSNKRRCAVKRVSLATLNVEGDVASPGSAGPVYSLRFTRTLSLTIFLLDAVPSVWSAVRSLESLLPGFPQKRYKYYPIGSLSDSSTSFLSMQVGLSHQLVNLIVPFSCLQYCVTTRELVSEPSNL